jgi:hypothetical protein
MRRREMFFFLALLVVAVIAYVVTHRLDMRITKP